MTDFAGAVISSITFGTSPVIGIWFGDTKVWPAGVVTTAMTDVTVVYSSGNMINAGGTNYATVQGTYITYIDGVEDSRQTVTLTPNTSSQSWLTISGNTFVGADRGINEGSERSATVTASYADYTSSSLTVKQQENAITSTAAGAIRDFRLNGLTGSTYVISGDSQTMSVSHLDGYRTATYTSGAQTQVSIPRYLFYSDQTWATANTVNNQPSSVVISQYSSTTDPTRSAVITLRDESYPSVTVTRTIIQQTLGMWEVTFPSSYTIGKEATAFTLNCVVRYMGSQFNITASNFEISPNASNIAVQTITHNGGGAYTVKFTCSTNTSGADKNSYIKLTAGPNQKTCHVVQDSTTAFDGLDVKVRSGDWALGVATTQKNTGPQNRWNIAGIIVACKYPITSAVTVNISRLSWQYLDTTYSTTTPKTVNETGLTQTINSGATQTINIADVGSRTYYGTWLTAGSPSKTPMLGLQVNDTIGFSVT